MWYKKISFPFSALTLWVEWQDSPSKMCSVGSRLWDSAWPRESLPNWAILKWIKSRKYYSEMNLATVGLYDAGCSWRTVDEYQGSADITEAEGQSVSAGQSERQRNSTFGCRWDIGTDSTWPLWSVRCLLSSSVTMMLKFQKLVSSQQ